MDQRDRRWCPPGWKMNMVSLTLTCGNRDVKCKMLTCPLCQGSMRVVNPNIDRNGLNTEDMDEDDWKNYREGMYDIPCPWCSGSGHVLEPISKDPLYKQWNEDKAHDDEWRQEQESERRMLGEE